MRHLQSISEMRKMNERIASLQAERERREEVVREQRRLLLSLGIGLVLVLSVLSVVLGQKKKIEHAYRDLYKMNRAAMAAEDGAIEKEDARASRPEMALVSQSGAAPQGQGRSAAVSEVRKGELLSAEQRQSLLDAIGKVMEDPGTYCSPDFSLGKLASLVHSNSKYVSWVINETYQKNFNAFVNDYRIRTARSRLADIRNYGNYTIKAIAESVGYKSNTTFVNAFKDITGMPPSVFLKLVKEEK